MTRWVRSGNTQKHKKMPGDATKWGEFDHQKRVKNSHEKQQKKIKSERYFKQDPKSLCVASSFSKIENQEHISKKNIPVSSKAKKSMERSDLERCVAGKDYETPSNTVSSNVAQDATQLFVKQNVPPLKKHKKNKKNAKVDSKSSQEIDNQTKTSAKVFEKKKEMFMKKLQEKRAKKGIMLLSSKVERKLYNIKKKLREKGVPPEILKEIIRKERRKEELKFRKTFNPSKLCFNCRQPGHLFADCPKKEGSTNQETGMCFKCGSGEHTSFKCPEKVQGFPFAKCFICKEQGHISKDCPKNKHGIYPKGGRCNLCGNVNHLKKDCPSLSKKAETNDSTITLHTIKEATSIDAEVTEKRERKKESVKKPKIVKF